ncbi:mandelate racemase/muconate lactonizing enzyme family protein [Virgibacillus ndiopensis]|uniref:mandelate racemase/muconate lactonizing enzyme family protein n=1 Tax=Virgibacillus ndiopensis TaxID=2004408 RepID=UPI000C07F29A|nr:mandelate racemase/muconate lactonizing enzyme family protein [Virgibacillus ndiopensis]
MKIINLKYRIVSVPINFSVISSVRKSNKIYFVLLDVYTDDNINGLSYIQGFNFHGSSAIISCLKMLKESVIGEDPCNTNKVWYKMWDDIRLFGHQGLATFALSMIDIALWDIKAKALEVPVYQLLGGKQRDNLVAYASDALWLVSPIEAAKQASQLIDQGFTAIKMRLGRSSQNEDIEAVKEVRNAVGEQVEIIADVNQGWNREQVINVATKISQYHISWLEEPVATDNMEDYNYLIKVLGIPIAMGENLYGVKPFHRFFEKCPKPIYTPDLQRIGGLTGWTKLFPLFECNNMPFSLHLFPEFSSQIFASINYSKKLEWMSWASPLFEKQIRCEHGIVKVNDAPGFGLSWDENFIAKHEVY